MFRRPPRSTLDRSSAASDVYKRQAVGQQAFADLQVFEVTAEGVHAGVDGRRAAHEFTGHRRQHGRRTLHRCALQVAVSYTHLRAHETVLDLVCRLLLEKKKQTTNTQHNNFEHTKTKPLIQNTNT